MHLHNIPVGSASGGDLHLVDSVNCMFHLGKKSFSYDFVVCKKLPTYLFM